MKLNWFYGLITCKSPLKYNRLDKPVWQRDYLKKPEYELVHAGSDYLKAVSDCLSRDCTYLQALFGAPYDFIFTMEGDYMHDAERIRIKLLSNDCVKAFTQTYKVKNHLSKDCEEGKTAHVLIETSDAVRLDELINSGADSISEVEGTYDLIARIKFGELSGLSDKVDDIKMIKGVSKTLTLIPHNIINK